MSAQAESDQINLEGDQPVDKQSGRDHPPLADPFSDDSVEGLFFPGAGRQEVLDQFSHLLRYGPSLLLLYGDQGVGKHFLVEHLVSQLDVDLFDVALINGDIMTTASALLGFCSDAWHSRQPMTLESFQQKIVTLAGDADDESKILLCVIKHAQFLDEETCRVLVEMLAASSGLPVKFVVVVDAAELENAEQISELVEQIPDHYIQELSPLSQAQAEEYLSYRLRTAGLGRVRFSEQQLDQIFNHSLGNLVRINQVAHALLMSAMPKPTAKTKLSAPLPWLHIGALVLVAVALLLLLFVNSPEPESPVASSEASEKLELAIPSEQTQTTRVEQDSPSAVDYNYQEVEAKSEPEIVPVASDSHDAVKPEDNAGTSTQQSIVKEAPIKQAPERKPETVVPAKQDVVQKEQKPKPVQSVPVPAKTVQNKASPTDERTAWIRSLPKHHYSVQLLGAKEMKTVKRFLAQYPSLQNLVYYKTQRNGSPWYVVIQGNYKDYDSAKAATLKYPAKLRKQGPWIRKVEAIQKDLSK